MAVLSPDFAWGSASAAYRIEGDNLAWANLIAKRGVSEHIANRYDTLGE